MDWWEERDRERSEEYAKGKAIVERVKEEHHRQICERMDKRRAGLLPPFILSRIEIGKDGRCREVWIEDPSWKPADVRGRKGGRGKARP